MSSSLPDISYHHDVELNINTCPVRLHLSCTASRGTSVLNEKPWKINLFLYFPAMRYARSINSMSTRTHSFYHSDDAALRRINPENSDNKSRLQLFLIYARYQHVRRDNLPRDGFTPELRLSHRGNGGICPGLGVNSSMRSRV